VIEVSRLDAVSVWSRIDAMAKAVKGKAVIWGINGMLFSGEATITMPHTVEQIYQSFDGSFTVVVPKPAVCMDWDGIELALAH